MLQESWHNGTNEWGSRCPPPLHPGYLPWTLLRLQLLEIINVISFTEMCPCIPRTGEKRDPKVLI